MENDRLGDCCTERDLSELLKEFVARRTMSVRICRVTVRTVVTAVTGGKYQNILLLQEAVRKPCFNHVASRFVAQI